MWKPSVSEKNDQKWWVILSHHFGSDSGFIGSATGLLY